MQDQIVAKIRKLRKENGFTQPQMAEKLHIDTSVYTRLEQGETNTWAKYFEELLAIFKITPEKFFEGIETKVMISTHNDCTYSDNQNIECQYSNNKDIYEKLMDQYEQRIKDKDEQIALLKNLLEKR
jgi:transcriptional regulator with XRE-family HTH domain